MRDASPATLKIVYDFTAYAFALTQFPNVSLHDFRAVKEITHDLRQLRRRHPPFARGRSEGAVADRGGEICRRSQRRRRRRWSGTAEPLGGKAMLGYTRKHLLVVLAAIVCVMTITSLLLMYFIPAPPSKFSIAPAGSKQIYEGIGNQYQEILARSGCRAAGWGLTNGAQRSIGLLNDPASNIKSRHLAWRRSKRRAMAGPQVARTHQLSNLLDLPQSDRHTRRSPPDKRQARRAGAARQRPMTEQILAASGVNSENTTLLGLTAQDAASGPQRRRYRCPVSAVRAGLEQSCMAC